MTKAFEGIKNLTAEELQYKLSELDKEIYRMRCELKAQRKLEKPHLLRMQKRERARVLTRRNQHGK